MSGNRTSCLTLSSMPLALAYESRYPHSTAVLSRHASILASPSQPPLLSSLHPHSLCCTARPGPKDFILIIPLSSRSHGTQVPDSKRIATKYCEISSVQPVAQKSHRRLTKCFLTRMLPRN